MNTWPTSMPRVMDSGSPHWVQPWPAWTSAMSVMESAAEVAGVVGVEEVGVGLVCTDHEVVTELNGVVGDAFQVSPPNGRGGTGNETCGLNFFVGGETEVGSVKEVFELDVVDFEVAADD